MCGFAGFSDYSDSLAEEKYLWMALVRRMAGRVGHRGPDDRGVHVSPHCALGHRRLSIMDPENGAQPMTVRKDGGEFTIAYNGEVYNAPELRRELEGRGYAFSTACDTEVVLNAYLCWGEDCAEKLNGIFAFAVDDVPRQRTFLCRDRFGVKPLFYTLRGDRLAFGSEIKALFEFPGVNPVLGRQGVCEVFGLGPARTPGCGVFEGISELKPGHTAVFDRDGFRDRAYFQLEARPHADDYDTTVKTVRELLWDTVERQLLSDAPLCAFLSGGLDSSVVTAIATQILQARGETLSTYSFEFEGNEKNFKPSSFQPDRDESWAQKVSAYLGTDHETLLCGSRSLEDSLREMFDGTRFPWSNNLDLRESLLKPEIAEAAGLTDYVEERLRESLDEVPVLRGESAEQRRMRQISYLNIRWFMATLLDRKDRCSMWSGLEVRVPYADHRLAQYVFNTPWEYKCPDGRVKGLLRDAAGGLLPEEVLNRKKSPYPKTYDPAYERDLKEQLAVVLRDSAQPIHKLLSKEAAGALLREDFDYGKPWFGQLMAGPQMLAYLLQVNYWMLHYNIYLDL